MSKANAAAAAKIEPTTEPAGGAAVELVAALLASQWKARESGVYFNTHEVVPNADTPIAWLERPDYWGNVSQKFRPGDTIIAFPRDGAWYAELLVWDAGQNWANVTFKDKAERPAFTSAPGVLDEFTVRRDPIDGWQAVRKSNGEKLKGGFNNAEDARRWLLDQQRVLKR